MAARELCNVRELAAKRFRRGEERLDVRGQGGDGQVLAVGELLAAGKIRHWGIRSVCQGRNSGEILKSNAVGGCCSKR